MLSARTFLMRVKRFSGCLKIKYTCFYDIF
nr:MAG TPA: hypothetical protein [Caudoviricetes sp.]